MTARIIPARAGFTPPSIHMDTFPWDHPRSRGVYSLMILSCSAPNGSSPLARGLHHADFGDVNILRIIPARAGFTFLKKNSE